MGGKYFFMRKAGHSRKLETTYLRISNESANAAWRGAVCGRFHQYHSRLLSYRQRCIRKARLFMRIFATVALSRISTLLPYFSAFIYFRWRR